MAKQVAWRPWGAQTDGYVSETHLPWCPTNLNCHLTVGIRRHTNFLSHPSRREGVFGSRVYERGHLLALLTSHKAHFYYGAEDVTSEWVILRLTLQEKREHPMKSSLGLTHTAT